MAFELFSLEKRAITVALTIYLIIKIAFLLPFTFTKIRRIRVCFRFAPC